MFNFIINKMFSLNDHKANLGSFDDFKQDSCDTFA